jgi:hypothetical protein
MWDRGEIMGTAAYMSPEQAKGPPQNNMYTLACAPRGRMLGGATQAMW